MADARMARPSHHHPQPSYGHAPAPGLAYPPPPSNHPQYHHHHSSSRHTSNGGPPPPQMVTGPPQLPNVGPPPDAGPPGPPPPGVNGHAPAQPMPAGISSAARAAREKQAELYATLAGANENTWLLIGAVAEQVNDQDRALMAFENALRHNPQSIVALNQAASIARSRDNFDKAIEYFQRILNIKQDNGEVWGSMGHCLLMKEDLAKAYTAYQQALYHLPNPKEPKLWYGIGILYDRYGSFEHAEEAFSSVLKMDPNFEKANEIYFRLGIIYKHQRKYTASLECFRYILNNPPRPLTSWDIWFQLGHVYEQDGDFEAARDAYMRVLSHQPDHAKVLQQLGWLHHQPGAPFADQEKAVQYLTKSLETDGTDAHSWYLLGRAFMAGQRYNKAYEAYQQAVYRDGRNPTFWCSIGVLYYQINQYRDALDAYSRAIRLNPFMSEVWYNLGSLYESCNNQITDAIDAYTRAAELDPNTPSIKQRLQMLQNAGANNAPLPPAPGPIDVHPSAYTSAPNTNMPANASPTQSPRLGGQAQAERMDGPPAPHTRDLAMPVTGGDVARGHSPGPFRGGAAPPPLQHVDESRGAMSRMAPLAPMEVDRGELPRDPRDPRDMHREGPPFDSRGPMRYDPAADVPSRRMAESPSSPRRRGEPYPTYQPYQPQYRDREREEWERKERSRPPPSGGPMDPRGPSPRIPERPFAGPGPILDRRPSPRMPEYREPSRGPDMGYPYYPDSRGPPPPGRPPYDPRDERRFDDRLGEPNNGLPPPGFRHPSMPRDVRPDDMRAPSPAPSTGSKAGAKRKNNAQTREEDKSKRPKEEKPTSSRKTAPAAGGPPGSAKSSGGFRDTSPKGTNASSPTASVLSSTHQQTPRGGQVPNRTVDDDYDEGVDALMSLHSDRTVLNGSGGHRSASSSPVATMPPSGKRPDPPSPATSSTQGGASKKVKADPGISPARPGVEKEKRTIIEVLNTPSISSPLPTPRPSSRNELRGVLSHAPTPAPATPREDKVAPVVPSTPAPIVAEETKVDVEAPSSPTKSIPVPEINEATPAPAATEEIVSPKANAANGHTPSPKPVSPPAPPTEPIPPVIGEAPAPDAPSSIEAPVVSQAAPISEKEKDKDGDVAMEERPPTPDAPPPATTTVSTQNGEATEAAA